MLLSAKCLLGQLTLQPGLSADWLTHRACCLMEPNCCINLPALKCQMSNGSLLARVLLKTRKHRIPLLIALVFAAM